METKPDRYYITFLRHGESTGNAENRYQGQMDFPLSKRGEAQARALAARWKFEGFIFDRVVTSPLSRAARTAQIIAEELGAPVEQDPVWMERHNGRMAGLTHDEIMALNIPTPDFINIYFPQGETGESEWELYLRAGQAVNSILRKPPARYLVVSHGALLNQVMYTLMGIVPQANHAGARFRFDNTGFAVTTYDATAHTWRIYGLNDHAHTKEVNADEITDV
jgi:broad specificity phosphatase PhoE